jgi:hypothetical protein
MSFGAGFEYKPTAVSWLKRDVLLFANSIGCTVDELHFLYELDSGFSVFPTYPIILHRRAPARPHPSRRRPAEDHLSQAHSRRFRLPRV